VRHLVEQCGADVNVVKGSDGKTPLFRAAENNQLEVAEYLARFSGEFSLVFFF
jgi:ankyrin repeat protein